MIDLKQLFGSTYRITLDESAEIDGQTREDRLWLYQLSGSRGHVFVQSKTTLGAYFAGRASWPRGKQLLAIPSARLLQSGDSEMSVEFDPAAIESVAPILGLYRRRHLAPEHAQALAEAGSQHRFAPGSEKRQSAREPLGCVEPV
jgi:hypothetical protein